VRTTFTEEQLQILQANFDVDSNPDGQDLERIAQITGLSKRVTQVWFQNSRARQKKHKEKKSFQADGNDTGSNDTWSNDIMQSQSSGKKRVNNSSAFNNSKTHVNNVMSSLTSNTNNNSIAIDFNSVNSNSSTIFLNQIIKNDSLLNSNMGS